MVSGQRGIRGAGVKREVRGREDRGSIGSAAAVSSVEAGAARVLGCCGGSSAAAALWSADGCEEVRPGEADSGPSMVVLFGGRTRLCGSSISRRSAVCG